MKNLWTTGQTREHNFLWSKIEFEVKNYIVKSWVGKTSCGKVVVPMGNYHGEQYNSCRYSGNAVVNFQKTLIGRTRQCHGINFPKIRLAYFSTVCTVGVDGFECPAACPVTCPEDSMHCPGGMDPNGCQMPDTCMPVNGMLLFQYK